MGWVRARGGRRSRDGPNRIRVRVKRRRGEAEGEGEEGGGEGIQHQTIDVLIRTVATWR